MTDIDERFAAWVRDRGEHHLRVVVLLTGDWHAAEDLVQTSLVQGRPGYCGRARHGTRVDRHTVRVQRKPSRARVS